MKRLITFLLALMLTWIGANAQTTDFTWALNAGTWTRDAGNTSGGTYGTDGAMERYGDEIAVTGTDPVKVLYETVTDLPAGEYTLTFYAVANNAWVGAAVGENIAQVYVTANGTTQTTDVEVYDQTEITDLTAYSRTFTVTVGSDGTLEYGLQNIATGGNWYVAQGVSLVYSGTYTLTAGDKVYGCTAELSHWTQTFTGTGENGAYALNTWSVEEDASGMVTPFLQTWVTNATLSDLTIDHDQLTDLLEGWYSVTVDARIMSETGVAITGTATLTANQDFVYLISDGSDGTYGTETEEYGTYTVECYVDDAGTLDIDFTIANANFNWLAWKNLSVVYLGETVDYHVGEATASATYVSPGQTVTLTFADCTKGDEDATLGVSSSASVTFGSTTVTLTSKGTITFTFDVPENLAAGEYTLTIPANTIVWTLNDETQAGNAQQTITFTVLASTSTTITDGDYLVVNNATGLYLGGCGAWGTQAVLLNKPQYYGFALQSDGAYMMDSYQYFSETRHYLGTNLYNDAETVCNWTLLEAGEDGYAIYSEAAGGYLTGSGPINTAVTVENTVTDNSVWSLVSKEDVIASMAEATEDNPVDVTALINFPGFNVNCNSDNATTKPWTVSTGSVSFGVAGGSYGLAAEGYNTIFDVNQTITLPSVGTYVLSAHGFYRTTEDVSVLYADEQTSAFPLLTTSISNVAGAWDAFLDGEYALEPITITTTTENEEVKIGFKNDITSDWDIFGELELLYYGVVEETVEWEMTTANWGTLILPFDVAADEVPEGLTVYTCDNTTSTTDDTTGETTTTVVVTAVTTGIAANTPYLVKGNVEEDTYYTFSGTSVEATGALTAGLLTGTFEDMDYSALVTAAGTNTVYLLQNHEGDVAFYPVTEESAPQGEDPGASLTANHCYLTLSSASGVRAYIGFPDSGEETGIVAVESETLANDAIYDLSGRRVSKAVKGVYIQNGKKMLVK